MDQQQQPMSDSSIRRDLLSAYVASGSRIGSWVVVLGLLYRYGGPEAAALVALVRGTIGILNYTSVGLAPALIRLVAEVRNQSPTPPPPGVPPADIAHLAAPRLARNPSGIAYANALAMALISTAIGVLVVLGYSYGFAYLFEIPTNLRASPSQIRAIALLIGFGTVLRLASDAGGAMLQAQGRIVLDNILLTICEIVWAGATVLLGRHTESGWPVAAALAYLLAGLLACSRLQMATDVSGLGFDVRDWWAVIDRKIIRRLFSFGAIVMLAQAADYLYAPAAYIIINRLLSPVDVAVYAPAVQIDAGLLVLVGGMAAVLLPRSALAHTAGDLRRVRRYYWLGTLVSLLLLLAAAGAVWWLSPWLLPKWLGNPLAATYVILPLVLIHTVLGGSAAVGRSVLLGIGRAHAFTASVLIAGVGNVLLALFFVLYMDLGLMGVVIGTILAVGARCCLWMPWYITKALRHPSPQASTPPTPVEPTPPTPVA